MEDRLMKNEKTEKKKIKISSKVVYVISLFLVSLSIGAIVVFALNTRYTGYAVETSVINEPIQYRTGLSRDGCGYVDNSSGKTIFVPTNTSAEWTSFTNNEPFATHGCTGDSDSFPNQGNFFTTDNNCGSWDYNCNGLLDKEYPTATGVSPLFCVPRCTVGYRDSPTPSCGQEGWWVKNQCIIIPIIPIPLIFCAGEDRMQRCR